MYMKALLFFIFLLHSRASIVKKINLDVENSYSLVGKTQEYIDNLNTDTKLFLRSTINRATSKGPITPKDFSGNWYNVEHEKIFPLIFVKNSDTEIKNTVETSYGTYIKCYRAGFGVIPAPPGHESTHFEVNVTENEVYKDESGNVVAISAFKNKHCDNGFAILIPTVKADLETYRKVIKQKLSHCSHFKSKSAL